MSVHSLGLEFVPTAGAHVHREEHVQLNKRGQHQEHGVHGETGTAHGGVQSKLVEPKGEIQQQQRRQQGYSRVLKSH